MTMPYCTNTRVSSLPSTLLFTIFTLATLRGTLADVTHIRTADDLIDFSEAVHQGGRTFAGETVVLEADIDMNATTRAFYPIGRCTSPTTDECSSFNGVFEGQGHAIRNIRVISDDDIVLGLFGYTSGAVIRDVIVDATCNFTLNAGSAGTYGPHFSYVIGGVVAACNALAGDCVVERCVSSASVLAVGDLHGRGNVVMGAVVGVFRPHANNSCVVRDCVTQGKMFLEVSNGNESRVGGVIGLCKGHGGIGDDDEDDRDVGEVVGTGTCEVRNSLHYGTIIHAEAKGTTPFNVGDIVGEIKKQSIVVNCVSLGTFSYLESFFYAGGRYGAIVGDVSGGSPAVRACYWPLASMAPGPIGRGGNRTVVADVVAFDSSRTLVAPVGGTTSLVDALNAGCAGSRWSLLRFYTDGSGAMYTPAVVLNVHPAHYVELPVPLKTGAVFNSWCTDVACRTPFSFDSLPDSGGEMALYAKYDVLVDSPEALVRLSEYVYNGNTYAGVTVYLSCDLDMSAVTAAFAPIGRLIATGRYFPFNGVFDGRGHVISNLRLVSGDAGVGLFAYSTGVTVRNVVLDASCTVTSTCALTTYDSFAGAVLSSCFATDAPCIVEGVVSAASVTVLGDVAQRKAFVGGIAGIVTAKSAAAAIRNCAVVASATLRYTGSCSRVRVGGICGYMRADTPAMALNIGVANCNFEGSIDVVPGVFSPASPDEPTRVSVGGVIGTADSGTLVRNCAANVLRLTTSNATANSTPAAADEANYGCIAGDASDAESTQTLVTHSYCTKLSYACDIPSLSLVGCVYNTAQASDLAVYNESTGLVGTEPVATLLNQGRAALPTLSSSSSLSSLSSSLNGWLRWTLVRLDPRPGQHYRAERLFLGGNTERYAYLPRPVAPEGTIFAGWFADTSFTTPAELNVLVPGADDVVWAYAQYVRGILETPQHLAEFAAAVASGFDHFNQTVFLAADVDMSLLPPMPPIDNFRGTFDGQGHVIDGLTINASMSPSPSSSSSSSPMSSTSYASGLFGSSTGATVRNVILGPSCTITAATTGEDEGDEDTFVTAAAGVIGECTAAEGPCVVRSCVTLATVRYSAPDSSSSIAYVGGVVGLLSTAAATANGALVANCANHGIIVYTGAPAATAHIGGIVGSCRISSDRSSSGGSGSSGRVGCYVENSLFEGSFRCDRLDSVARVSVGGIVGSVDANNIVRNCATATRAALPSHPPTTYYYGAVVGASEGIDNAPSNEVSNCYWLASQTSAGGGGGDDDDDAGAEAFGTAKAGSSEISYAMPFRDTCLFDERVVSGGVSTKSLITALNSHIAAAEAAEGGSLGGAAKWSLLSFVKRDGRKGTDEVRVLDSILLLQMGIAQVAPLVVPSLPPLDDDSTAVFLGWFIEDSVFGGGNLVPVDYASIQPGKTNLYPMWNVTSMAAGTVTPTTRIVTFIIAAAVALIFF